jgi:hypothetical protein
MTLVPDWHVGPHAEAPQGSYVLGDATTTDVHWWKAFRLSITAATAAWRRGARKARGGAAASAPPADAGSR